MINNLELDLQSSIENYKKNPTEKQKQELQTQIRNVDLATTSVYLNKLKSKTKPGSDIQSEATRIKQIITILSNRIHQRNLLLTIIEELSLNITLPTIPNLEKEQIFVRRLKNIEIILNTIENLQSITKQQALETLNKEELKKIMKEFSLIKESTDIELEKYIDKMIKKPTTNHNENLKILEFYENSKSKFPNLNIPNMGLVKSEEEIHLDNQSIFIK